LAHTTFASPFMSRRSIIIAVKPGIFRSLLGAAATITTPAAVAGRMMNRFVPTRLRTGVARALPLLSTPDFAEAARLIS
jgi:hypothetical protein